MAKDRQLGIRVSSDVMAALKAQASADNRTVSHLVNAVLENWLRSIGRLKEKGA